MLSAEAHLRIQMSSIKPNIKEIYSVVKECHFLLKLFVFGKDGYHKNALYVNIQ